MHKRIAVAIAATAAVAGCGGSSWVDPTSGAFSAQNSADVLAMLSSSMSAVATGPGQHAVQGSNALTSGTTVSCAVSGDVTVTPTSSSGGCDSAGNCNFDGTVVIALNACKTQTVIGNGSLNVHAWGSETVSGSTVTSLDVREHIEGGIEVRNAADSSLIGTCGIFLDAHVIYDGTTETVQVSGWACKQTVAQ